MSKMTFRSRKNLTRYTYVDYDFEGWRLCIIRGGTNFTKYFSDKSYGGPRRALKAAEDCLADVKRMLDTSLRLPDKKLHPKTIELAKAIIDAY